MANEAEYRWPADMDSTHTARNIHVGDVVEYVDPTGASRNALVTAVWAPRNGEPPSLNLVFVSLDLNAQDPYGRQLAERATSVVHMLKQAAPGMFWRERKLW